MTIPLKYAGIGSRQTPPEILKTMAQTAILLARSGHTCNTGACIGADQAFGNGAIAGYGKLHLFLPWPNYEQKWIQTLKGDITITVMNTDIHNDAIRSVFYYHPKATTLKDSVIKLHARNFLILQNCAYIICWTPNGAISGGTGQAIRIAQNSKMPIYNLGNQEILENFQKDIKARIMEIPEQMR